MERIFKIENYDRSISLFTYNLSVFFLKKKLILQNTFCLYKRLFFVINRLQYDNFTPFLIYKQI